MRKRDFVRSIDSLTFSKKFHLNSSEKINSHFTLCTVFLPFEMSTELFKCVIPSLLQFFDTDSRSV